MIGRGASVSAVRVLDDLQCTVRSCFPILEAGLGFEVDGLRGAVSLGNLDGVSRFESTLIFCWGTPSERDMPESWLGRRR